MSSSWMGQSKVSLTTLHKGLGVRRDNLRDFLGEWPGRWRLDADDDDPTLRAHLMFWVNETLAGLSSPHHTTIGQVAYNTAWDLDLRGMRFVDRLLRLEELQQISRNTAMAAVRATISQHVVNGLARRRCPADRMPDDLLRSYLDRERAYHHRQQSRNPMSEPVDDSGLAAEVVGSERFRQAVRGLRGTSIDDVIELFLPLRCHVPGTSAGPLVANTPSMGCMVYAFTSLALLRAYEQATGNDRIACHTESTGRKLVARVRRLPAPAGIVVDPAAGDEGDVHAMLVLPPAVVALIDLSEPAENDR